MYNRIFISCLFLLGLLACKNEDKKPADKAIAHGDSTAAKKQSLTDIYFFKTLEGTIAGKPVVMNIVKAADRVDANYYYVEQGQTIFLSRNWEKTAKDSIYLIEITNITSGKSPSLTMAVSGDGIRGRWTSGDGKTSYPIDLREAKIQPSVNVIAVGVVDSARYLKLKKDTPTLKTAVSIIAASDEKDAWLNEKVKSFISGGKKDMSGLSMQQAVNHLVKQAIDGYAAEVDSSLVGVADDGPHYFLNREYETLGNVIYNQNGFLVLSIYNYAYTGGAHGNYGTSMYCFDINAQKQMTLGDILSTDSVTIGRLLEQNYRKQYAVPDPAPLNSRLFVKNLEPNNNFYFSPKGLGFSYSPYEIASYADGEIKVWIPFSELKPYLNADFARRMSL